MSLLSFLGLTLSAVMGFSLGLIGAGGSILIIPILVYFFNIKPILATSYSLFIVGGTAALGASNYWRMGFVNIPNALSFTLPALTIILFTRYFLIPIIPDPIFSVYPFHLTKDGLIMGLFSFLLLLSSYLMLKCEKHTEMSKSSSSYQLFKYICASLFIGLLTGLIGAGGGFLIIPILILLMGLSMHEAIGTSLTIVSINALVGFNGDLVQGVLVDWKMLLLILTMTISGMILGSWFAKWVNSEKLKHMFALYTFIIGLGVLLQVLYLMWSPWIVRPIASW